MCPFQSNNMRSFPGRAAVTQQGTATVSPLRGVRITLTVKFRGDDFRRKWSVSPVQRPSKRSHPRKNGTFLRSLWPLRQVLPIPFRATHCGRSLPAGKSKIYYSLPLRTAEGRRQTTMTGQSRRIEIGPRQTGSSERSRCQARFLIFRFSWITQVHESARYL